jgi:thioredoxin 1
MKSKSLLFLGFIYALVLIVNVDKSAYGQSLNSADFQKKMQELSSAPLVDVRTPGEFNQSHLKNAVNINIGDQSFPTLIGKLNKSKPVLIYCLSGSRSAYALQYMKTQGFKEVYELSGGLVKWRALGLPETSGNSNASEMSSNQLKDILNTDKIVLIDFYADWCAPCKKMAPSLDEIKREMADKVKVIKINADQNKSILRELQITAIPTLQVYKNNKLVWSNTGFLTKEEIVSHLKN